MNPEMWSYLRFVGGQRLTWNQHLIEVPARLDYLSGAGPDQALQAEAWTTNPRGGSLVDTPFSRPTCSDD